MPSPKKTIRPPKSTGGTKKTTRTITIEEKVRIFREFFEEYPKGEVNGKTVYKGYPIGQWGIQIRNSLNQKAKGKKSIINLEPQQEEYLKEKGILERQVGPTIDVKIQELIDWSLKYPKAIVQVQTDDIIDGILREYAENGEENVEELWEKYKKLQKYYEYVRQMKYARTINFRTR